jgi:hypothetical protein
MCNHFTDYNLKSTISIKLDIFDQAGSYFFINRLDPEQQTKQYQEY